MFINFIRNLSSNLSKRSLLLAFKVNPIVLSGSQINTAAAHSEKASLKISQSCVDRLNKIAPKGSFLRITIDGGGCSGFQYRFNLDTDIKNDDICIEKDGAKIVIDSLSLDFVKGSTIEYHEELIRSAFRIVDNPQADTKCSCGTSFSVKGS